MPKVTLNHVQDTAEFLEESLGLCLHLEIAPVTSE